MMRASAKDFESETSQQKSEDSEKFLSFMHCEGRLAQVKEDNKWQEGEIKRVF